MNSSSRIARSSSQRFQRKTEDATFAQRIRSMGYAPSDEIPVQEIDLDDESAEGYFRDRVARQQAEQKDAGFNIEEIEIDDQDLELNLSNDDEEIEGEEMQSGLRRRHTGPVKIQYISNKSQRQKTFSKRKNTLMKLSRRLAILTGAKVKIEVTSESGSFFSYGSELPIQKRDVRLQVGPSCLSLPGRPKNMVTTKNGFDIPVVLSSNEASKRPGSKVCQSSKSSRYSIKADKVPKRKDTSTVDISDNSSVPKTDQSTGKKVRSSKKHGSRTSTMVCCEVDGCNVWTSTKSGKSRYGQTNIFICNFHKNQDY